jgi:glycosyltransferase involved in cell wall biosynthesis
VKLLIIVSQYHRRGGFPRYGAQLAVALRRRGHDVTVLTRHAETGPEDDAIDFRFYRTPGHSTLAALLVEPAVVTRMVRRTTAEFDRVIAVGLAVLAPVVLMGPGTHRSYFLSSLSSLRPTSPRWWVEKARPSHRLVMAWERAMLRGRHPQLIVVGTEGYRAEYQELFGIAPERTAVVPLGVELDEFSFDAEARERTRAALGMAPCTRVLLNVAGRGRQKGLDVLAAALSQLPREDDWCFLFAGAGSTSRQLRAATKTLRRSGHVQLLGPVAEATSLYSAADLLVFPSRFDPWGLVVTEALACGLPVVASSRAGASIAVRRGENGTIIDDPCDPVEVRDRILEVWDRPFDRAVVRDSAAWLSIDTAAGQLEQHLERLSAPLPSS